MSQGLGGSSGEEFWVSKLGTRMPWAASGALSGLDSHLIHTIGVKSSEDENSLIAS
jgi:hypothetical protein